MNSSFSDTAIILTQQLELKGYKFLGSSGWIPPEEREVVDWMILIRILGWHVILQTPDEFTDKVLQEYNVKWVIITGKTEDYPLDYIDKIVVLLKPFPALLIAQAESGGWDGGELFGTCVKKKAQGKKLQWVGNGIQKAWRCESMIEMNGLGYSGHHTINCILDGHPVIISTPNGSGKIITLGFHPGQARDHDGIFSALLKHMLIYESVSPVAWYQWNNTVILRMDDPGSLQVVYDEQYQNSKLSERDWLSIGEELHKRNARMSLGYVCGWVDDGDSNRGELTIQGEQVLRIPGKVYSSPHVKYKSKRFGHSPIVYDYESEFKGIEKLRKNNLAEVELHGYTHLNPDRESWLNAPDRYSNDSWYREFGDTAVTFLASVRREEQPFAQGLSSLKQIFTTTPSTLICPGDVYTSDVLEQVINSELLMLSSYYLAIKLEKQLCWAQHICAPYLNEADASWFKAELPVVGYFHDFDIKINGIAWFTDCLNKWEKAGARHFVDFRILAGALAHYVSLQPSESDYLLHFERELDFNFIPSLRIGLFFPAADCYTNIDVKINNQLFKIPVSTDDQGEMIVRIPPPSVSES